MTRWIPLAAFLSTTVALAAYSILVARHAFGSALFLGLAGGVLVLSVRSLYRAASSLFTEPPVVDVVVATGARRKELEREKTALLKAIKELEFDHEMGKVSDADFAEIGGIYRARAIRVIRQLDESKVDYGALIEEELAKKRGGPRVVAAAADVAKVEAPSSTGGCPQCGTPNDSDAVFCKKCAHRLLEATA